MTSKVCVLQESFKSLLGTCKMDLNVSRTSDNPLTYSMCQYSINRSPGLYTWSSIYFMKLVGIVVAVQLTQYDNTVLDESFFFKY